MNERIQELAFVAEVYADSIVDAGGEFHHAYTKKLVELILLECIDACEVYRGTKWGKAAECISDKIKERLESVVEA